MSDHRSLAYLATPYSKYPGGLDKAFVDAARLAGLLLKTGVIVYSPIAHTHPIAVHSALDPLDHDIWLPFDEAMMARCSCLIVAMMDGWRDSRGIAHEIEVFKKAEKPIFHLDPKSLSMSRTFL